MNYPGPQVDHGTMGITNLTRQLGYKDGEEGFEPVLNLLEPEFYI